MHKRTVIGALLIALMSTGASAQDGKTVIANASKAMGMDNLAALTYSGTATNGNYGQSRHIAGPLQITAITSYTRAIDLNRPASRATGPTMPPAVPGQPLPAVGVFNQNISAANVAWAQQLQIWVTPWGFLKGAAVNNATVKSAHMNGTSYNVVTWSPAQKAPSGQAYRVVGYINPQSLVDRVETWVEHSVVGDLHVDTRYSNYQDFGGLKVPTRIVQKQAEMESFTATITSASANPATIAALLTPPPPAAQGGGAGGAPGAAPGGAPAPPQVASEKMADGVYRITGGYVALAIEFKDHIVVLESGQNEARGLAVLAEARKVIPNKPIRYLVNTHAHFDHAGGLAPIAAEGITIITQQNNKDLLAKALGGPRTLVGDNLAKTNRKPRIEGVREKRVLKDDTHTVELYHVQNLAHTDGMLIAYLPKERILFSGDFNVPNAAATVPNPSLVTLVENTDRLKLDFERHVLVHAPNPDRPQTKADLLGYIKGFSGTP
jgi:glyoxylase-like metal-dependent hydrolase (beta-lactamase superfamily II)